MDQMTCWLPGGYIDEAGQLHQQVQLRLLSGREEELLADYQGNHASSLVTTVLSRCMRQLGSISPVSEKITRNLLVGDRQYLVLKLRDLTFGEQIQATIICPQPDCRYKIDIDFSTGDIPVKASEDKGPIYSMELSKEAVFISDQEKQYQTVTFRLPNGSDQETLAPVLLEDETQAANLLLKRCLQSIGPLQEVDDQHLNRLSPQARREIEQQMEQVAPQVALTMEGDCPECGNPFEIPFDLQTLFLNELKTSCVLLYREMHYLAFHYHWSEQEIMGLSKTKRRKYIEILADEIEKLNRAI